MMKGISPYVTKLLSFACLVFLVFSCDETSSLEIEYYKNGNKKTEYSVNEEGLLHGASKSYYENGETKYSGVFINGLRSGDHKEYHSNGNLSNLYTYVIENGHEKCIAKKLFSENGLILFDGKVVAKEFYFRRLNSKIFPGDTLKLLVKLKEPTYFNSVIYLGDFDPYLKLKDKSEPLAEFKGKKNEVLVSAVVKTGNNSIKGLFRDFTMKLYPDNDTLAFTVAEESYFEYQFKVDPRISL